MAVKIRLSRKGRKKAPFYHIIAADARAPRDGKFIEKLGTYNPLTKPATIDLDRERAYYWLSVGAQPTETARSILRFKGVLYRKHLNEGVKKGALTQEAADAKYNEWIAAKDAKVAARFEETAKEIKAYQDRLAGIGYVPQPKKKAATLDEQLEAADAAPTVEATAEATADAPVAEAPAAEEAAPAAEPVAEAKPEPTPEPVAEAPAPEPTPEPEPVKEAAPVVEEVVAAAAPTPEPEPEPTPEPVAKAAPAADVKPDDLTKIEGIGPKIKGLLIEGGIPTFAALAAAPVEKVKGILNDAGPRYKMHNPTTWGQQAQMAADGKWDELKKWQDESDGGKPITSDAKGEEE